MGLFPFEQATTRGEEPPSRGKESLGSKPVFSSNRSTFLYLLAQTASISDFAASMRAFESTTDGVMYQLVDERELALALSSPEVWDEKDEPD